jgi:hypothetical protein
MEDSMLNYIIGSIVVYTVIIAIAIYSKRKRRWGENR